MNSHRLSTITSADQILVLHEGSVYERGSHDELLAKKGRYYNMWRKQIRAEKAAEEARVLSDRAAALREQAMARPGSRDGLGSEDTSDNDAEADKSASDKSNSGSSRRAPPHLERRDTDDGKPPGHP